MSSQEELLSGEQAREVLGVSRTTLHRLLTGGELKGLKAGGQWRFRREDLMAYLERRPSGLAVGALSSLEAEFDWWRDYFASLAHNVSSPTETPDEKLTAIAEGLLAVSAPQGISDIHLETGSDLGVIRVRSDGVLRELRTLPIPLLEGLITCFKAAASMAVDERLQPQDGRIRRHLEQGWLDVRAASLPTVNGETMTLRLIMEAGVPNLRQFSSRTEELEPLRRLMNLPYGLLVIGGLTGSGKTSTMYAMLAEMVSPERKVVSVEDPVEIRVPGVQQSNVNRRLGLDYAALLRAVLRNDPDVIFCSETGDHETAEAVIQAPLTGHLVMTTVSASSAAEAITRLLELGVQPADLAAALRLSVGQVLVRRVCRHCAQPAADAEIQTALAGSGLSDYLKSISNPTWKRPVGCPHCRQTGYLGRIPLLEFLEVGEPVRKALSQGAGTAQLHQMAESAGMVTLAEDGLRKAGRGETTLEEVLRVVRL